MSVLGRNAVWGSTMTTYRSTKTPGTGGQTSIAWSAVLTAIKLELHTLTDETLRQVFGVDSRVELVAFDDNGVDVLPDDGFVVTAGNYSGETFRVLKTRKSRKYIEIGLRKTGEVIP